MGRLMGLMGDKVRVLFRFLRFGFLIALGGVGSVAARDLHAATLPRVTVAAEGKADFHTLQAAVDAAPETGELILIAPGIYREKLRVTKANIHLIGTGQTPAQVVLTYDDSSKSAGGTSKSASVTVQADGFEAENLTFENLWEIEHPEKENRSQAVALLVASDKAVLDRVRLLGAQDTLYANSRTCRETGTTDPCAASREFFNDCYVEGHVDYIFGDAQAVFDRCELHSRVHDTVTITAQSRHFEQEVSAYFFLHCKITGADNGNQILLGRPWRDDSTVTFYDTEMDQPMAPAGWLEWDGRLKTSTYREYLSHGPGVNGGHRIVASPPEEMPKPSAMTPKALLAGSDGWDPEAEVAALRAIR